MIIIITLSYYLRLPILLGEFERRCEASKVHMYLSEVDAPCKARRRSKETKDSQPKELKQALKVGSLSL